MQRAFNDNTGDLAGSKEFRISDPLSDFSFPLFPASTLSPTYQKIYRIVRKIPRGKVATYGQIARLSGYPGQARLVGYALNALRDENANSEAVPWWRVINARGMISLGEFAGADLQRELLEQEGVVFYPPGKVDLKKYGWKK